MAVEKKKGCSQLCDIVLQTHTYIHKKEHGGDAVVSVVIAGRKILPNQTQ